MPIGIVVDASDPLRPTVKLRGDATAQPTTNYVHDYVPTENDQVRVVFEGGLRIITNAMPASQWRTSAPSPVFASGVTVGDGTIDSIQWLLYRRAGTLRMDYRGRFLLGSASAVTGAVTLTIPAGLVLPSGTVQHRAEVSLFDATDQAQVAWWSANAASPTVVSLRVAPSGQLDASTPFVWAAGDVIRWDISGLEVEAA